METAEELRSGTAYWVAFANLQLRIAKRDRRWAVQICDLSGRELLHEAAVETAADGKVVAVDFALSRLFGAGHNKNSKQMAESLAWNASV